MTDNNGTSHDIDDRNEILQYLTDYVLREFLGESDADNAELTPETPLLEWGILNSMNIMILVNHVREKLDVTIQPVHITGKNFRTLNNLTDLVLSVAADHRPRPVVGGER